MRVDGVQSPALVGIYPLILGMPLVHQPADRTLSEHWQIAADGGGVLASEGKFPREAEVIAHKSARAGHQARGKHLVMAVMQAQHPRVIVAHRAVLNLEEPEITLTFVTQPVRLRNDRVLVESDTHMHTSCEMS